MSNVNVATITARDAARSGWNFQPSFQRQTEPSNALTGALKASAKNNALVIPVMLRNNEVGDGRKRMLVVREWAANELKPPKDTFTSEWTELLDGTKVVVCDYKDMPLHEFLAEFESHNQISERMSAGELLNAEFHSFPEDVQAVIAKNPEIRKQRRLVGLSFLGYLLTGSALNARTADVLKAVKKLKKVTPAQIDKQFAVLKKMTEITDQISFALRHTKGVRVPSSKGDQATILRLIQNFTTDSLKGQFERLADGWAAYVQWTKESNQRESTGDGYTKLAECFGLKA